MRDEGVGGWVSLRDVKLRAQRPARGVTPRAVSNLTGCLVMVLFALVACSPAGPVEPPAGGGGGGVPACLANPYADPLTALVFSLGDTVTQPTGERWFKTVLPAAGSYEFVVSDIPQYFALGTAVYQDNFLDPLATTRTRDYASELRVSFEAEAGVLLFKVNHIPPVGDFVCDRYTFVLRALP